MLDIIQVVYLLLCRVKSYNWNPYRIHGYPVVKLTLELPQMGTELPFEG
jgi:hypothetical protein